jgi:23S rRNA pseudouridine1911/1915/1917 synthase
MITKKDILYEDNHLVAINKKIGEIVQADITNDVTMVDELKQYLIDTYNKPGNAFVGVIHRIDRPVSGVVVFAKTSKALARMVKQFKVREIKKNYWAIVQKKPEPPTAELNHYISRNTKQNKSYAHDNPVEDSKPALLEYALKANSDNNYLLEVDLKTGRHHQIRCQLSKMGFPIKGDVKYDAQKPTNNAGIYLHAREIIFTHPVKNEVIKILANPPDDIIWNVFLKKMTGNAEKS